MTVQMQVRCVGETCKTVHQPIHKMVTGTFQEKAGSSGAGTDRHSSRVKLGRDAADLAPS